MRNVLLSITVVAVLIAGGLSGTFAHFSDTEESTGNYLETGSLDLKVNGYDDPMVPPKIYAEHLAPCKSRDYTIDVENVGQCDAPAYLFMHIKNVECGEVPDKIGQDKPEPERVAEDGGWLDQMWVRGLGPYGENCELTEHILMSIQYDTDRSGNKTPADHRQEHKIADIECINKYIGRLDPCEGPVLIWVDVHLQDVSEDEIAIEDNDLDGSVDEDPVDGIDNDVDGWIDEDDVNQVGITYDNDGDGLVDEDPRDGVDNDMDGLTDEDPAGYFDGDDPDVQQKSWNDWPTNALMKDWVSFDILFSLSQVDP